MHASDFTLILVVNETSIGTGFLIHSDGLVATCYHVIRNAFGALSPGKSVIFRTLNRHEGRAIVRDLYDERADIALLQITGAFPPGLKVLPLIQSASAAPNTLFSLSGYGEITDPGHQYDFSSAAGKIVGPTYRDGIDMLNLESPQLLRGMSGGAIFCASLGGAVGLLSARYTIDPKSQVWMRDTGWAARSEAIAALDESRLKVIAPVVNTRESVSNFESVTAQTSVVVHAGQYIERQINETHIDLSNLNLKLNWKRPQEFDTERRWIHAVGRDELLTRLYDLLNPGEQGVGSVVLVGSPGTGKSTLASLYVDKYGERYPGGVLWVEMGPYFDIEQAVQPILDRWASWCYGDDSLLLRKSIKWQQLVFDAGAVKSLLGNHGEMLVVMDDVWDTKALEPLFAALPAEANFMITTRDRNLALHHTEISVDALLPDQARSLLQLYLQNVPVQLLDETATRLSYHAQALRLVTHALAVSSNHEQAVQDFLQQIKRGSGNLLSGSEYFARAFDFSYEALDETARYRLRQLGVLAQTGDNFSTEMAAALWEVPPAEGQKALEDFYRRSLVLLVLPRGGAEQIRRWSIHALVAETLKMRLKSAGELQSAGDRYLAYVMQLRASGFANAADMPHVLWVGHTIVGKTEKLLGYDPESVNLDAVTIPSLDDGDRQFLRDLAEFIGAMLGWLLTRPEYRVFARRWLAAFEMAGLALQEPEMIAVSFFAQARWHISDGRLEDALPLLERVQDLSETYANAQIKGWGLNLTGFVYQYKGETERALNCFEAALTIASENDPVLTAHVLANLSGVLLNIGETARASETMERLLPKLDGIDDFYLRHQVTRQLGMLQVTNRNINEALKLFETALDDARRREVPAVVADLEDDIGFAHYVTGDLDAAEEHFRLALAGAEETQHHRLRAISISHLGAVQYARSDLKGALERLETALAIFDEYPDKPNSVHARALLGEVHFRLGDTDLALDLLRKTLPELHHSRNTVAAVHLINTVGTIYRQTGRVEEGLTFFRDTLPIIEELNFRGAQVTILNWLSILLQEVGNMQQAMYYFDRAKEIVDKIENTEERATTLSLFASLYRLFGNLQDAYATLKRAVDLWRSLNNVLKLTESLVELAILEWQRGEIDAAQRTLDEVKDRLDGAIPTPALAGYYNAQGLIYLQLGRIDAAAEKFDQSAQVNKEVKNPILRISNLNNSAMIDLVRGQLDSSETRVREAIERADEIEVVPLQVTTRTTLAFLMYVRGDTEASVTQLDTAIRMLDENGLTTDSTGQDVDMLRAFASMIKNRKDTPEESLRLLLWATTWDSIVVIVNARRHILLDPALNDVLHRAIVAAEKRGETLFAEVMRIYQRLLYGCREKGTESTLRRERATFIDTTIELWWGYLHRCNRQHTAALTHFNHVLQNNPDDRTALIERGWIYRRLGRYEQALDDFRRVERLQDSDSLALQGMGVVQFDLGQPDEALATLARALQRQEDAYTYQWRAAISQAMRDLPTALADLDRAIKLAPRCSDHHYWRSLVYLQSKDLERARSGLDYVIGVEVDDKAKLAYAYFWRAIAHDLQGHRVEAGSDWAQARVALKDAVDPIVHWCSSLLLLVEDGDWNRAQESYTRLLKSPCTHSVLLAQVRNLRLLQLLYPESKNIETAAGWLWQRSQENFQSSLGA